MNFKPAYLLHFFNMLCNVTLSGQQRDCHVKQNTLIVGVLENNHPVI